jgi:hypothetical protein
MIQYFNILMYYVLNGGMSEKFYPTLIVWYRYIREPKIGLGITTTSTQYYSIYTRSAELIISANNLGLLIYIFLHSKFYKDLEHYFYYMTTS